MIKVFQVVLFLLSLQIAQQGIAAVEVSEKKVEKLAEDLENTKKTIINEEVKQRKIMSALFDINRKMKRIVSERSDLVQERMLLESTTQELAKKIDGIDTKLKTQKSFLRERLSAIYRFGGQGVARLLFSSANSTQLERNLKVLGMVAKRDLDLIKDYSTSVKELEKKKSRLTQRLAHLKKIETTIRSKEERLTVENNTKNRILDAIRKSKKFALMKLNGLREKSMHLALNDETGVLDLLFRPSFFEQKGMLPPPVTGKVIQGFGLLREDQHSVVLPHKGVLYKTGEGSKVKSVFAGTVAFVGSLAGYGKTLVIDHGDHYYTVYSHTDSISVGEGDEVAQNQIIASSGEGLYFEVRHFSEPYDPSSWIKGTL